MKMRVMIISRFLIILLLVGIASSCVEKGHVCYQFEVYNTTDTPMTIQLSSWGNYTMYINGMYDSEHRFQKIEMIEPISSLMFSVAVGDNPNRWVIPSSIIPAWEYIEAIECNGVTIPKEYFSNRENWDLFVENQINGTFTVISLVISPELVEQFSQN